MGYKIDHTKCQQLILKPKPASICLPVVPPNPTEPVFCALSLKITPNMMVKCFKKNPRVLIFVTREWHAEGKNEKHPTRTKGSPQNTPYFKGVLSGHPHWFTPDTRMTRMTRAFFWCFSSFDLSGEFSRFGRLTRGSSETQVDMENKWENVKLN